jgi:hypothetical protein
MFLKNCWYVAAWDHELIDGRMHIPGIFFLESLFAPAQVQRHAAVAAPVLQRDDAAGLGLVEEHGLLEEGARQQAAVGQLVVPGGHVPAVLQEHRVLQQVSARSGAWTMLGSAAGRIKAAAWPLCSES